ncbi:hypothetical protein BME96_16465 [Virgibacillus halodenitrificans]|uniref:Glycosyl transferase family 1 domain-containing protein n=1 Tax=Virgibacillus halodenitrificans TaxID=1482 RepID=A0AAC9J2U1_VIRHA|nr:glycosyltransferase [Virgibacillus halodenitrificans]APC49684.1 hypothetical protein BME96_16465 [Virgibacillus halodenitrificans]
MFRSKKHLYVMTSSLPFTYGGRTSSLLQRCRMLTENKTGVESVTLLTSNYNPDYNYIYQDYRNKGTVNNKISFLNLYDWLKWSSKKGIKNNYLNYLKKEFGSDLFEFKKKETSHVTFYYENGVPKYYLSYNKNKKRMGHIDVFLNHHNQSAKRLYMNKDGNIHKIRYFRDEYEKNVVRDVFLDQEMNAYLTREYSYKGETLKIDRNILFRKNGEAKVFKNDSDLINYWFENIFKNGDKVINDVRVLDKPLLQVKKKIKRIFQVHGPHISVPNDVTSETKKSFKYLLANIESNNDIIVTLTEAQKENMIAKYPRLKNKIVVIPHCFEKDKVKIQYNKVIPKKICVVSRLVPLKRIDHTLKAFSEFLKERPEYKLDIYGTGEEEEPLKELVAELEISSNVNFKGFTDKPHEVFQTSEFFIMTSRLEGFGMTVLESVINGCPVISYDITWGPSEIISRNNGILVENNNIQGLKNAMLMLADNPLDRKKVAQLENKYFKKSFLESWIKLVN